MQKFIDHRTQNIEVGFKRLENLLVEKHISFETTIEAQIQNYFTQSNAQQEKLIIAVEQLEKKLDALLKNPEDIPTFHQLSPDQKRISKGNNWKTFAFYVYGQRVDDNCTLCPKTAAALEALPGMRTAMFSILAPRYHIEPHKGPTRAVIRAHLGLKIPKDRKSVWIRVHDQYLHWEEGKVVLFDDAYEHEVRNDTDEFRAVLFIDIDRPMDRLGTLVNRVIVRLIQASSYVKQPLKNVAAWNRAHKK
mgnify:CR=1 FL=1